MFIGIHSQQVSPEMSLAEFAYAFSPLVEETASDTVVIDVEGCALLFGSTYELANEIARQAQRSKESGGLGCKVNVALAGNPDAAIHAAKFSPGVTFTAPGEELTCLGRLPLKALQCSLAGVEESQAAEVLETLNLWGVRSFEEFAALPVTGVSERLGQDGLKLQRLAGGKTDRHLKLKQPEPVFKNSFEVEYPISQLEALSFILARLLNQTCASLNANALATNALQVELKLANGALHELKLNLPYPMRDHKVFLKLLLLDTEMHPPPAAVVGVSINCEPVKPRVLQTGLFTPLAPEPEKLELMLARLAKLVGAENIGSPELLDTHRPDAFRVNRFELKESKRKKRSKQQTADSKQQTAGISQLAAISNSKSEIRNPKFPLGFRVFRPPLRALVQAEGGQPLEISAWDKNKSVYGKVVCSAGPWRTTGEWWRADAWARDEWDVAVESRGQRSEVRSQRSEVRGQRSEVRSQRSEVRGQKSEVRSQRSEVRSQRSDDSRPKAVGSQVGPTQILYRIYRELSSGTWFVEGVYD
jgi:protein ImuB